MRHAAIASLRPIVPRRRAVGLAVQSRLRCERDSQLSLRRISGGAEGVDGSRDQRQRRSGCRVRFDRGWCWFWPRRDIIARSWMPSSTHAPAALLVAPRYQPLVTLAFAVAAGMVLDRYGRPALIGLTQMTLPASSTAAFAAWWCLAALFLIVWWLAWRRHRTLFAAWPLLGRCRAGGRGVAPHAMESFRPAGDRPVRR